MLSRSFVGATVRGFVPCAFNTDILNGTRQPRCNVLDVHGPAIHLVVEADDRWSAEMPDKSVLGRPAVNDLLRKMGVNVVHGVDLSCGCIPPPEPQLRHAALHLAKHGTGFFP